MLAIVIPYYKIDFFEETLLSLANQTDKRFRIYIGNDNSPSDPEKLINNFKNHISLKYQKFETNLGSTSLVQQWERCLDLVQNELWVMILGDDDVLTENVVETFYESQSKMDSTISVIRYATCNINKSSEIYTQLFLNEELESSLKIISDKKRSSLSEYVFRREEVTTIKFKDLPVGWYSDLLAVLEFSDFSTIFSINKAQIKVRTSDKSISGTLANTKQKQEAKFLFYEYLLKNYRVKFDENILSLLKNNWNNIYANDKRNFNRFWIILRYYSKKQDYKSIIHFIQIIINSYKKK
jgi:hypothetical protein